MVNQPTMEECRLMSSKNINDMRNVHSSTMYNGNFTSLYRRHERLGIKEAGTLINT